MIKMRDSKKEDYDILSRIAYESEAYWGYDIDYMKKFEQAYSVTKEYIEDNIVFLMEQNDEVIGFYGICNGKMKIELDFFYIVPDFIGQGYGKVLWDHLKQKCKEHNIKDFELITSPQAMVFYKKMGAIEIGEVESVLKKGRTIPRLRCTFE